MSVSSTKSERKAPRQALAPARASVAAGPPVTVIRARWIDLGLVAPQELHAAYAALATRQVPDAQPIVLWARARAHLCIGYCQNRALEVVAQPDVPVVRRALGGGAVWVDEHQLCHVLVVPTGSAPRRAQDLIERALMATVATLRAFGIPAQQCGGDVWVEGRKIAGSGAATLGACSVVASSFMLRFPAARFARCVALPSARLRDWLAEALELTVTDWERQARIPAHDEIARTYRSEVQRCFGWTLVDSGLRENERARPNETEPGDDDWLDSGARRVPEGIRLNARSYLFERAEAGGLRRTLVVDGRIVRTRLDGHPHD